MIDLWTGLHQRGALGEITMPLGLERSQISNVILALRVGIDQPLVFWYTMEDDPGYPDDLQHFHFSDNFLTITIDAKTAPITARTLMIPVGAGGILALEIGIRAQTDLGDISLLRGRFYLDGGVVPSAGLSQIGGVDWALMQAMKDELLDMIPSSMTAQTFLLNEAFIQNGFLELEEEVEHEPLAVYMPGIPFQEVHKDYYVDPNDAKNIIISTKLLTTIQYAMRQQAVNDGIDPDTWSLACMISYRIKKQ
jgi:hypothetical protein